MKGKPKQLKLQQIKWTEEGLLGFKYRENVSLEMRASHHFPGSAFRAYLWEAESERVRVRGPSALSHVTKPSLPQRLCYLLLLLTRPLATAPRPGYEGLRPLNFIPYKRNPPLTSSSSSLPRPVDHQHVIWSWPNPRDVRWLPRSQGPRRVVPEGDRQVWLACGGNGEGELKVYVGLYTLGLRD